MKHLSGIIAAVASVVLLPVALHAAELAAAPKADSTPAAATKATAREKTKTKAEAKKPEARCDYVTGSRIHRDPPVNCDEAEPGRRSFSADEIRVTGEPDLSEALRKLDPRLQ